MFRVKSPQDFGAGIVFLLIGIAGVYFARDLTYGTAARMGPGYFPTQLGWLIIAIGAFVGIKSLMIEGPPVERPVLRPIVFVLTAIVIFGYVMNYVGLAITAVVMTLIGSLARRNVNLIEALVLGVGLSIGTIVIFVYGLGQPLPAWWGNW
ncbi:MAG TPA: tripartite tricarboxylate transporter TctB family protein [Xanthobacteraceae bacterium]